MVISYVVLLGDQVGEGGVAELAAVAQAVTNNLEPR